MKNIYRIPTKRSKIGFIHESQQFHLFTDGENPNNIFDNLASPQHIYITSDEVVKDQDWYIGTLFSLSGKEEKPLKFNVGTIPCGEIPCGKRIVLTTDPKLIEEGVQELTDDFLRWYIKNPWDTITVKCGLFNQMGRAVDPFATNQNHSNCTWRYLVHLSIEPPILEDLKTSNEWQLLYPEIRVLDADGWDRKNYQYSWFEELISLEEYEKRRMYSTCMGKIEAYDEFNDYAWVGIIGNEDKYIPARHLKSDIWQEDASLPYFLTKEECQKWCDENHLPKEVTLKEFFNSEKLEGIKESKYFIGVDTYDKDCNVYCLSRIVDDKHEVILTKRVKDENEFKQEVENLAKYFNAIKLV